MQAIILAAGMGKRLKDLTKNNTKCMVSVNGTTLAERTLTILDNKNLSKIVVVIGYEGQKLASYINSLQLHTPIIYIDNPIFDKTNNIYSLSLAKEYLTSEDTLLLESDLIFEKEIIDIILDDPRPNLALVDKFESWMDGTCMTLDEDDSITNFISGKHLNYENLNEYYKTVNIYKFSKEFSSNIYVPFLEAYSKAMGDNEYYESVIKLIAMLETKEIRAKRLTGQIWYEIDDIQDLDIAETLFPNNDEEQYHALSKRYGGYWRYPKLLDFCYLVNPYYPPEKMINELKSNFEVLLTQYPSGMDVNSLLASKFFGVRKDQIVVGNGAAELINALMQTFTGTVGFIRPTFEEYPNRYFKSNQLIMNVSGPDFNYNAEDIIDFFGDKVSSIILINPDNPSGNYITYNNILKLLEHCKNTNTILVLDESFIDFADCESISFLDSELLDRYANTLVVVKSISKSYGVPGNRLGVLASGNNNLIQKLKKSVSIWNINSFGEFYMQIAEKYKNDYAKSLAKLRECRKELFEELCNIPFLRPIPSQANFIMCEVINEKTSLNICIYLLKNNIFIKDLTSKIGDEKQYIRLAVRSKEDNKKLIDALKSM